MKTYQMPAKTVSVKVDDATYRVPGRAMQMTLTITNNGDSSVRLGEFNTAVFVSWIQQYMKMKLLPR